MYKLKSIDKFKTTENAVMINEELDTDEVRATINFARAKGLPF